MRWAHLLISLVCGILLAACSTTQTRHPDFGTDCEALANQRGSANVDCVRVYYGTNRDVDTGARLNETAEADISGAGAKSEGRLNLGRADIWLPRLIEEGGARARGETPMLRGEIPDDPAELSEYVFLTRITASGKKRFLMDMQQAVEDGGDGAVLLFVHGFNVDFESALIRSAQLAVDLGQDGIFNPGTPALFSWPSAGSVTAYVKDRKSSLASAEYLTEFLNVLTKDLDIQRINIIAHSMGNRVLTKAIEEYAQTYLAKPGGADIEFRIIMAAADVDREVFRQVTGVLDNLSPNVTIYTSDADRALKVSEIINRATRLGYTDGDKPYIRESEAYETVDATGVATELFGLGHSYYSDNPFVLGDMLCTLLETAPEQRALKSKNYAGDPDQPEFFEVRMDVEPAYQECSLQRRHVPADPDSATAPEPTPEPSMPSTVMTPPPAPTAPPMEEPQPYPSVSRLVKRREVIYYDSGVDGLSDEELNERLTPYLEPNTPTHIRIDAHTDTVGSERDNLLLSEARANIVRNWLIGEGVDPFIIETEAYGETDLALETADDVDEPANRRVVVTITYQS